MSDRIRVVILDGAQQTELDGLEATLAATQADFTTAKDAIAPARTAAEQARAALRAKLVEFIGGGTDGTARRIVRSVDGASLVVVRRAQEPE